MAPFTSLPPTHPTSAPLPPPHPPPQHLHHVYARFMTNPNVARWLLTRNSGTDFLSVRLEDSLLVNISTASQPEVIPPSVRSFPFSNVHDLLFLDHVVDEFAVGYIWGKPGADSHPLAHLSHSVSMSGWDTIRCRRFATSLRPGSMLERVEFSWFENHRLIVTITQSPAQPGAQFMYATEAYFFSPLQPNATLIEPPLFTAHISDVPLCDYCKTAPRRHCKCNTDADTLLLPATTVPHQVMAWKRYIELLTQSKESGRLTAMLSVPDSKGQPYVRVSVTQAYSIIFGSQEAINEGIHLRLKQMLLSRPAPPTSLDMPLTKVEWKQIWPRTRQDTDECLDPVGNSAIGRKQDETGQLCGGPDEISTCSPPIPGTSSWIQDPLPSPDSVVPISDNTDRRDRFNERDSISPTTLGLPSETYPSISTIAAGSTESALSVQVPSYKLSAPKKRKAHETGLCAHEKMGKDCGCSAEAVPNQFLSTILNSSKGMVPSLLANFAEMNSISPLFPNSNTPGSTVGDGSSPVTADRLPCPKENGNREGSAGPGVPSTQVKVANCVLPSPMSMILDFNDESNRKKSRVEPVKDEILPLSFDPAWDSETVEDGEKYRRLRESFSWTPASLPERPLSALGRALGMERAPSPFGITKSFDSKSPPDIHRGQEEGNKWLQMLTSNRRIEPLRAEKMQSPHHTKPVRPGQLLLKLPDEFLKANQQAGGTSLRSFTSTDKIAHPEPPKLGAHKRTSTTGGSERGLQKIGEKRNTSVQCEICQATFSKRANLVRHTKTVHNNVKPFVCPTCGSRFGLKADLHRHVRNIHEKRAFCCRACGRSYAEQEELDFHCRVTHEKDSRPFECGQCGMRFGRRSSRRRHEQTVHTEKRFDCTMCDKSYSQRFDAIKHGRKAHGVERVVD